jgi:PhzF family phenazine biosynthesis protein
MQIPLYQVDAFTSRLFSGNPAAVCPLQEWLPDATMQAIAAENNLAETAFFVPQGDGYLLRWFTPTVEVELCGHATLASGYVVTQILALELRSVAFDTLKAGRLVVTRGRAAGDGFTGLVAGITTGRSTGSRRARCRTR